MNMESPVLPKSFVQRFAKQIAFGVFCSCIATVIVQFAHIKQAVLYACSAATFIGGDPLKGEKGLFKKGDELVVEIGTLRRHIGLPTSMAGLSPSRAKLDRQTLTVEMKES